MRKLTFLFMSWLLIALSVSSSFADVSPVTEVPASDQSSQANPEMVMEVKATRKWTTGTHSTTSTEWDQTEIRKLPQGSEISLPKLISTTSAGVVGGPFGQMFFRGNHGSIQYQIDGVQLPDSPSNTFGQAFSPRNIDTMEVITGGFPAEFGQRLSAVVNIVTKTGPETPGGELELNYGTYNTITPHLLYGGSNESGSLHYFLSLNYNQTDRGLDTPQPESDKNQYEGGRESIHNRAYGNSEFGKVDWQVDNSNRLSLILFNAMSNFEMPNYPASFVNSVLFRPGATDQFGNHDHDGGPPFNYVPEYTNDRQAEINSYAQLIWKHTFSEKSFLRLAPYYKYSSIVVNNDPVNDLASLSGPNGAFVRPTSFGENRHTNNLGLKGDYSLRASESHLLKTGFQVQASRTDGFISVQRDPNVAPFTQGDPTTGFFQGVYIQDDYTISKAFLLNAGLRYDATQLRFSGLNPTDSLLQPRIGLNYFPGETTQFHIFYGKLFNPAPVENLRSTFSATAEHQNPQPYDIKAQKDDYYEVGVSQQLFGRQVVAFNVFYKDSINVIDEAQLLNTSISQPFNLAVGYSQGAELSIRGQLTQDWSEYINYSYTVAKGKGISGGAWASDHPVSDYYQFLDHLQVHTANAGLTYSKNHFWWTGQGVFGSGLQTGHEKQITLPSHFTFDTTVGYEFQAQSFFGRSRISGDLLNIFDNRYPITIANGFNGSHYAPGRQFILRLAKLF